MTQEEKILILAALFHDIGKFEQRCSNAKVKHQQLGSELVDYFKVQLTKILGSNDAFDQVKSLIEDHHNREKSSKLLDCLKMADHLSASERVEFSEPDADLNQKWSHKYLSSLFSKVYLNDKSNKNLRYYEHKELTKKDYKILIPEYETEEDIKEGGHSYDSETFEVFKRNMDAVLGFYKDEEDFNSLINLILILYEKYMWCIPDFTGSDQTDISLFNHIKDVAGIAHALYKSGKENKNLNLIIGDLPGIQKYIFNVANKKPAKILRGRSIYVQILTRQFASILLNKLGLTEANLIMLAGGKFYILAQDSDQFDSLFNEALSKIENILIKNFNYQLNFSAAAESFNYEALKEKDNKITFGDIIDRASYKLLQKRNQQFKTVLFDADDTSENNFILPSNYIKRDDDSNKVKCAVTGIPIKEGRGVKLPDSDDEALIDRQVSNEYRIGSMITSSNLVVELSKDYSEVFSPIALKDYGPNDNNRNKILLNPDIDELLSDENLKKDILRNTLILEVANYATDSENESHVMEFDNMEDHNNGAKFMTLIKGDVDNLGLIMSSGLVDDDADYTAISRTTTLSNHLKYFFSFSLNGFLADWERDNVKKSVEDNFADDQKVYTIFAGGDDLMLVCPQSSSLKLVDALNNTFNDFVCNNKEVHISYSLTNFKHNTPIRIVADMSEESQSKVKNDMKVNDILSRIDSDPTLFHAEKDKAAIRLFDTSVKNTDIINIERNKALLINSESKNHISKGLIRNLLEFSQMMQNYIENGNTKFIIWHPLMTYMIKRKVMKKGRYPDNDLGSFFDSILKINKTKEDIKTEKILYPTLCETIYSLRK